MRSSVLLLTLAALVAAAPVAEQQVFTAPASSSLAPPTLSSLGLSADVAARFQEHIDSLPERRLVKLAEDAEPIEISEGEKALLTFKGVKFMDVTDEVVLPLAQSKEAFPTKLTYDAKFLKPLFKKIDTNYMKEFLTKFSSFPDRRYRSASGKESQQFLLKTLKDIAKTNKKVNVSFEEVVHSWGQNSIVARFEPAKWHTDAKLSEKIVIIGAHQDSTNMFPWLGAPGADDDGSGTTSSLMAFSALVNSSFSPSTNPVEFHYYSAEEGGLLGSQGVAQKYAAEGRQVRSMLQIDMTAWVKSGTKPTVGIITDFVDPDFTSFLRTAVSEYTTIGFTDTLCGYACSDHASWSKIGAPSGFTIESTFPDSNKLIHTTGDKLDASPEFSFEHMAEFSKVAIALAVELGGGASLE
ncbi:peptidase family M28 protein [Pseudohyphozyma bogoriensis]|nr:peptidase family M28 protein [Pseudohyphozyma bogoriensis]